MAVKELEKPPQEVGFVATDDPRISWACMLDQNCPGAKIAQGYWRWCPACLDEQPQTQAQAIEHHMNNDLFYGTILPFTAVES